MQTRAAGASFLPQSMELVLRKMLISMVSIWENYSTKPARISKVFILLPTALALGLRDLPPNFY